MSEIKQRAKKIIQFVLEQVEQSGRGLSKNVAEEFGITRQSASRHIRKLVDNKTLIATGAGQNRNYKLAQKNIISLKYSLSDNIDEFILWIDDIKPNIGNLPTNVIDIWEYGITEMINNAKDHSNGETLTINITQTATETTVIISDNGIGIFKKIKEALSLPDQRQSVLELAKGKLTTDPQNHSGEGIFFTSRLFDSFWIFSNDIAFSHQYGKPEDWILERQTPTDSTFIILELSNYTSRTIKEIFDEYSSPAGDYAFSKTVVPLRMASFGTDRLISRSQAKRVMSNLDKFHTILLDFDKVSTVGQAFTDEVFRVFQNKHPDIKIIHTKANEDIERMIKRVISTAEINKK